MEPDFDGAGHGQDVGASSTDCTAPMRLTAALNAQKAEQQPALGLNLGSRASSLPEAMTCRGVGNSYTP